MSVPFVHIINKQWPTRQVYSIGDLYSDLVWLDELDPILENDLVAQHLPYAIEEAVEYIRVQAVVIRNLAHKKVLGTDDANLIRLYEEKTKAAKEYIDVYVSEIEGATIDASREQMLVAEAAGLGITAEYLAGAIMYQSVSANEQLLPILGTIEAVRRARIYQIENATTVEAVTALRNAAISWPDLSSLVVI
jgi:hypothetical protein